MLENGRYNVTIKPETKQQEMEFMCESSNFSWLMAHGVLKLCNNNNNNEKALRETQTLRVGCSKAEPKMFAPPQTPFPEAQDGQNLISWRWSLPLPTDPVWWRSMHAISSYRGNRPTNKPTNPPTHKQTGPIAIHCAAKLSAQCNNNNNNNNNNTLSVYFRQFLNLPRE